MGSASRPPSFPQPSPYLTTTLGTEKRTILNRCTSAYNSAGHIETLYKFSHYYDVNDVAMFFYFIKSFKKSKMDVLNFIKFCPIPSQH